MDQLSLMANEAEAYAYGTKNATAEQVAVKAHARKRHAVKLAESHIAKIAEKAEEEVEKNKEEAEEKAEKKIAELLTKLGRDTQIGLTMPQVFAPDGSHIGGFDQLREYFK